MPGLAIVCHSHSCGSDAGLTFWLHPQDAAPLLPATEELGAIEQLVLDYTISRKASYAGKDRYQQAVDDLRGGYRSREGIARLDRALWDAAKGSLIARGLLNKAGAVTVAGRNARRAGV
jgi:hypothetical protein